MSWRKALLILVISFLTALALLWLARARIAAEFAAAYFRNHGVASSVEIGDLGLSGVSGRFALGPADAPDIAADRIELHFDPLSWIPRVVEVRLVNPVIRARVDDHGTVTLPSLQGWISTLQQQQGKSQFVSDDLAVALTGLRALLATPAGALEVDGDVKLVKSLPVSASLQVRPAALAWQGMEVRVKAASLSYERASARAKLHFSGAVQGRGTELETLEADATATGLSWSLDKLVAVRIAALDLSLAAATPGAKSQASLRGGFRNVALSSENTLSVAAEMQVSATVRAGSDLLRLPSVGDPVLARTLEGNLSRLDVRFAGQASRRFGKTQFQLTAPLEITGERGARLSVTELALAQDQDGAATSLRASLAGAGLPRLDLASRNVAFSPKGLSGAFAIGADFSYAMLRNARLRADGVQVSWQDGRLLAQASSCAQVSLVALHPGASDLAKSIAASVCPVAGQPLLAASGKTWALRAAVQGMTAILPLTNTRLDGAAAALAFDGKVGTIGGTVALAAGRMTDLTPAPRFHPLLGSGLIALKDGVFHGNIAVSDSKKNLLGETSFTHTLASGAGTAHVSAPKITFAPDHLQPQDISPLLAPLRRAEGSARFEGDIGWTQGGLTSSGTLAMDSLDFMTPLGKAHAIKTTISLVSLLPPVTAPDQQIAISRIDWTLPFTGISLRFGVGEGALQVRSIDTDFAEGHASLGAFTIKLSDPAHLAGTIQFKSIALNSLITASNLGEKVRMEGKVSGNVPFTVTPEGFRIRDGHVAADGSGRLSFDRSLWTQGGPAANAVQDFAYQALEYLAFDSLSADLNSIPGGRLQVVFKIKGRSDPPKTQTADVAVSDILNGTALYKPIPLPSGTPIDLTLDTSLNFDELLKSYAEAWSKSLDPGASP